MGWLKCDPKYAPGHEGYIIGMVKTDRGFRIRELNGNDKAPCKLDFIAAGCECGWRSPRFYAGTARWFPCCVDASEHVEEQIRQLWDKHMEEHGHISVTCSDAMYLFDVLVQETLSKRIPGPPNPPRPKTQREFA